MYVTLYKEKSRKKLKSNSKYKKDPSVVYKRLEGQIVVNL